MRHNRLPRYRTAALYRLYGTLTGTALPSLAVRAEVAGLMEPVRLAQLGLRKPRQKRR
jgi:hypothetical protein